MGMAQNNCDDDRATIHIKWKNACQSIHYISSYHYTPAPGCLCCTAALGMLLSWKAGAGDGAASASAQTSTVAMWTPGRHHLL